MTEQPIDIHYTKLDEWLADRQAVLMKKDAKTFKELSTIAPKLMKMARFDVPALKKQRNRLDTQSSEFSRRVTDSYDQEVQVKRKYSTMLEKFGLLTNQIIAQTTIPSSSVDSKELSTSDVVRYAAAERVTEHIDKLLDVRLAACFRDLCVAGEKLAKDTIPQCFKAFSDFLTESQRMAGGDKPLSDGLSTNDIFPVLTRLCALHDKLGISNDKGGYDLLETLRAAEEGQRGEGTEGSGDAPHAISWGDEADDEAEPTIDFGEDEGCTNVEINWDDEDSSVPVAPVDDQMDCATNVLLNTNGVVYNSIASLMDRLEVRRAILDELDALRAFLLESSSDTVEGVVENSLTTMTRKTLHRKLAQSIDDTFLSLLKDPITVELLRVKSDPPARVAFLESLARLYSSINGVVTKRAEYNEEAAQATEKSSALEPQIKALTEEIQTLQAHFEKELSRVCAPRPVYIVGDINSL